MSINNPYQTYKQNSVETASPGELTLMLYKGVIKFIRLAKNAINEKKIEEKNNYLLRAQAIIQELMVTLDTSIEISKNLMQMYDYMNRRLIEANISNNIEILDEVEGYAQDFHDTWKEIIHANRKQQYQQGGRV